MSSSKGKGTRTSRKGNSTPASEGAADTAFIPPVRISTSVQVLQARQEPPRTRGSVNKSNKAVNAADIPQAAPHEPEVTNLPGKTSKNRQSVRSNTTSSNIAVGTSSEDHEPTSNAAPAAPAITLSSTGGAPPTILPPIQPATRKEKVVSFGDNGLEMWGYSSEESMYDGPSVVDPDQDEDEEDVALPSANEEEDELDSMSDPYIELPTLDEPSVAALAAPPTPPVCPINVGGRKGKKTQNAPARENTVDDSVFTIKCWIKTGANAINDELEVASSDQFPDFKAKVASFLGVREAVVELCYYFSFAKDKAIRQLTSEKNWETLITEARQYRSKPATKRFGNSDSWFVQLKEISELTEGRGGSKKKAAPAVSRGVTPQTGTATGASYTKEALIQERMQKLNSKHRCSTHGGQICLIPGEAEIPIFLRYGLKIEHLRLSDADRRAWAEDMLDSHSTVEHPDKERVLPNICARAAATRNIGATLAQSSSRHMPPPITPSRYQYSTRPINTTSDTRPPGPSSSNTSPATRIDAWLEGLDRNPLHKHPNLEYTSFIQVFADEDIATVGELVSLGLDGLTKVGGVKVGTARHLLDWAKEDL